MPISFLRAKALCLVAICSTACLLATANNSLADNAIQQRSPAFFQQHCIDCHQGEDKKGNLDLSSLAFQPDEPANQAIWIRIHDRVAAKEMPPASTAIVPESQLQEFLAPCLMNWLQSMIGAQPPKVARHDAG